MKSPNAKAAMSVPSDELMSAKHFKDMFDTSSSDRVGLSNVGEGDVVYGNIDVYFNGGFCRYGNIFSPGLCISFRVQM